MFSGATPAAAGRLAFLDRFLPLGIVETSHFLGSLVGAALLLLSHGIARRLDAAYYMTAAAIGAGIVASLLKGGDYEEAVAPGGSADHFVREARRHLTARRHFSKRAFPRPGSPPSSRP